MRSLVFRSQQSNSNPLLASSWVESSPRPGVWKGDNRVDSSTSRRSSPRQILLQGKIRPESSTTVEGAATLDQQVPSSLSSSSSSTSHPPNPHPQHGFAITSHCPTSIFRTPTATAIRKHKPHTRNHHSNQGGGSGTTPHSPASSCSHVSFCKQVHMVYIPKLESHQVTNLFYGETDLELFRQEVAMERLSLRILQPQKLSLVEEDDDYDSCEEGVEDEYKNDKDDEFEPYYEV